MAMRTDSRLGCVLASEGATAGGPSLPGITVVAGTVGDAIRASAIDLAGRDAYVAGPPAMMRAVFDALAARGIERARIAVDAFGA